MSILDSLVDQTYVINLAHRTDRWTQVQQVLKEIGYVSYERFDAYGVDHLPPERYYQDIPSFQMSGWWGNKFSHYGVIDKARQDKLSSVMVFEDDVILHPEFTQIVKRTLDDLEHRKWDWLQFGGNHRWFGGVDTLASPIDGLKYVYPADGLIGLTPSLARIVKMLTAHAYIAREGVYDFILDNAIKSPLSIDGFYAYEVHARFECYCVTPCVAKQSPGMNDIGNVYTDYRPYIGD